MAVKVVKFGGTSMASADSINQVADIVNQDKERAYVIVSAPGKRFKEDIKVTDMLYSCFYDLEIKGECAGNFNKIRERFIGIVNDLGLDFDIVPYLDQVEDEMIANHSAEFCASRGEYLSAVVMAQRLGYKFIDAKDLMVFSQDGEFLPEETNAKVKAVLKNVKKAVIPGFYGADKFGTIHTFSRGGSDVSGAVVARAVKASIYENWTDVNGFMVTDPRIVPNPKQIPVLSYLELRELSYMGANVLHPESIFPVRKEGIAINIKNTFFPDGYEAPRPIREKVGEYKGKETDYLMRIIHQIRQQPLLLHLIELTRELYRDTVDDDQLAERLEEKKLTAFTRSLMQVLDEQTALDEGYMPLTPADNRLTKQIRRQLDNHLNIED